MPTGYTLRLYNLLQNHRTFKLKFFHLILAEQTITYHKIKVPISVGKKDILFCGTYEFT